MKKILFSVLIVGLIAGIFYGGFLYGQSRRPSIEQVVGVYNKEIGKADNVDFSLFWDAWTLLQKKYVNRENLDFQKMVYGAISGLVSSLGDPYSTFMPPPETKKFNEDIKGSFDGIGAEIGMRKEILTIISPLEGSPAKAAGLLAGDKIFKIDDKFTENLTVDEAVNLIRGQKGTQVTLTILREGWSETKDFKITRDVIKVPVIKYELKKPGSSNKQIAYVQLYQFSENAGTEFSNIANQILTSPAQGIVLDLRNNPGGYLEVAVDISSWFLEKGDLVVTEDFGNGEKNENRSFGYNKLANYPVIVLINEGSASASEILAGALRDNRQIKLVGKKSFGKGSVQQLEELRGGSSLKVTVAKWITPSGHSIMDEGLAPDVEVERSLSDIDEGLDPQLDKALEMLK